MAKKKKQGLLDKVLHGTDESSEGTDHETEQGHGDQEPQSSEAPSAEKHQHKKFDKFKRGNS